MLDGPSEMMRLASPSPSTSGGGVVSFCGLTRRQVMRVGAVQVRGGTTTLRPWCLLPRMEPPRASTMKLTRKLPGGREKGHHTHTHTHTQTRAQTQSMLSSGSTLSSIHEQDRT